jgi:hypothetical protein
MGWLPESHAWNPHRGGMDDQEGHRRGPKGVGPKASRSSAVHDVQHPQCFWASNDVIGYTTEELLNIAAPYTTNKEVARPLPITSSTKTVLGNSQVAPSGIAVEGTKKDTKVRQEETKVGPSMGCSCGRL